MVGIAARLAAVAVARGGALGVPDDPRQAGWWTGGAMPANTAGSVVFAGSPGRRGSLCRSSGSCPGIRSGASLARPKIVSRRIYLFCGCTAGSRLGAVCWPPMLRSAGSAAKQKGMMANKLKKR